MSLQSPGTISNKPFSKKCHEFVDPCTILVKQHELGETKFSFESGLWTATPGHVVAILINSADGDSKVLEFLVLVVSVIKS